MSSAGRGATRKPSDFYETPPALSRAFARFYASALTGQHPDELDGALDGFRFLEPCVGRGSIAVELEALGAEVDGWDLVSYEDECRAGPGRYRWGIDFTRADPPAIPQYDAVITNPPFSLFEPMVENARRFARGGRVIFLLRINALGAAERLPFYQINPARACVTIAPRPAFVSSCTRPRRAGGCSATYPLEYRGACTAQAPGPYSGPPEAAPVCGFPVRPATDSCEYAWIGWGHGLPFAPFEWLDWRAERDAARSGQETAPDHPAAPPERPRASTTAEGL